MGCGCGGKKAVQPTLPASSAAAPQSAAAVTYDVFDSAGDLVASSTNIVFARVEARRTGGTVIPRQTASAQSA